VKKLAIPVKRFWHFWLRV